MTYVAAPHDHPPHHLQERVAGLERDVIGLSDQVKSVREDLKQGFNTLSHEISKVVTGKQTNWSTLANWAGVILAIVTTIGFQALGPVKEDINSLKKDARVQVQTSAEVYRLQGELKAMDRYFSKMLERAEYAGERPQ